jgi:hypothetical protein
VPKSPKPPSKLDQLRALREVRIERDSERRALREARRSAPVRLSDGAVVAAFREGASRAEPLPIGAKWGRPRIENRDQTLAATKPWEAKGMSGTTWFRREAEKKR